MSVCVLSAHIFCASQKSACFHLSFSTHPHPDYQLVHPNAACGFYLRIFPTPHDVVITSVRILIMRTLFCCSKIYILCASENKGNWKRNSHIAHIPHKGTLNHQHHNGVPSRIYKQKKIWWVDIDFGINDSLSATVLFVLHWINAQIYNYYIQGKTERERK